MYEGDEEDDTSLLDPIKIELWHSLKFPRNPRRLRSLDHAGPEPEPERRKAKTNPAN